MGGGKRGGKGGVRFLPWSNRPPEVSGISCVFTSGTNVSRIGVLWCVLPLSLQGGSTKKCRVGPTLPLAVHRSWDGLHAGRMCPGCCKKPVGKMQYRYSVLLMAVLL